MAFSSASKILKPGGEKLDKFEEQLAEVRSCPMKAQGFGTSTCKEESVPEGYFVNNFSLGFKRVGD